MITEEILESALRGDRAGLIAVPKTELHSHSALAAAPSLYKQILGPAFTVPEDFGSLSVFLTWVGSIIVPLIENKDLALLTLASACEVLRSDGVSHAEISVHLPLAKLRGTSWTELAPLIDEIRTNSGLHLSLELGIPRPVAEEMLDTDAIEALETGVFDGIDIYDDELFCSLERFEPIIATARSLDCYVKIHSGEVGDPARMWDDIDRAQPDAIQHGVRASEDRKLMRLIADEAIPLHICPTSNVKLGVTPSLKEHPMRKLFDAGVIVTVNTDDYIAFGKTVSEELLALYREGIFNAAEIEKLRENGFNALLKW